MPRQVNVMPGTVIQSTAPPNAIQPPLALILNGTCLTVGSPAAHHVLVPASRLLYSSTSTARLNRAVTSRDHGSGVRMPSHPVRTETQHPSYTHTFRVRYAVIIGLIVIVALSVASWFLSPKGPNQVYATSIPSSPSRRCRAKLTWTETTACGARRSSSPLSAATSCGQSPSSPSSTR